MHLLVKKFKVYLTLLAILIPLVGFEGCRAAYYKVPIVKSRKHFRPYDAKKDRHKKRTRIKKYKSLKSTNFLKNNKKDE